MNLQPSLDIEPIFVRAIKSLRPNANWYIDGDFTYKNLKWDDPSDISTKPSEEELELKINELKNEEPMRILRLERNRLITETDWWVFPDRVPTEAQLKYREDLRNLPDNSTPILDLDNPPLGISGVNWPTKPE